MAPITLDIVQFMDKNFMAWRKVDKLSLAILLAAAGHFGQHDKGGNPYVTHPMRVMFWSHPLNSIRRQIAILHDLIEDTLITLEDLHRLGFCKEVIDGVRALTKNNELTYSENIDRVLEDINACYVKRDDLRDNLDVTRLKDLSQKTFDKNIEYLISYHRIDTRIREYEGQLG